MEKDQICPELALLRSTFQSGMTRSLQWRRSQLQALDTFLVECEGEIAAALHDDLRKSAAEVFLTEANYLRGEIRCALKHLKGWMKPHRVSVPLVYQPAKAWYSREPYGVVLIMGAWNYPLHLCLAPLVSAIAAGNCVIIKPSELAPHTSAVIAAGLARYLDREAIAVVEGGVELARALLEERFNYIFYTGSEAIGREVMSAAAKHLTPLTLELGGKCPCIVDEHSDISVAARRIVWAKFLNAGQTCLAPDYVLVHETREAELLRSMEEALISYYGDEPRASSEYSRIVNAFHVRRLESLMVDASIQSGGSSDPDDCYVAPTILCGVTPTSPLMQSEIFGPLLPVIAYKELGDALNIVAGNKEPLAIYLFSSDRLVQERVVRSSRSGGVCINDLLFQAVPHGLPFGGVGSSGFGCYHGRFGFETFSRPRSIFHRALHPDLALRYPPYSGTTFNVLKRLLHWFG